MKTNLVLFTVSVLLLAFIACNTKVKQAREYHEAIVQASQAVIDSSLDFTDAVLLHKKDQATQALENYERLVERVLSTVQQKGNFKEDTTLHFFTIEMLQFYQASLNTTFRPFLFSVKENSFTQQEIATADSLVTDFTMTESLYWGRFNWAEKKFYKDNDLAETEKQNQASNL